MFISGRALVFLILSYALGPDLLETSLSRTTGAVGEMTSATNYAGQYAFIGQKPSTHDADKSNAKLSNPH